MNSDIYFNTYVCNNFKSHFKQKIQFDRKKIMSKAIEIFIFLRMQFYKLLIYICTYIYHVYYSTLLVILMISISLILQMSSIKFLINRKLILLICQFYCQIYRHNLFTKYIKLFNLQNLQISAEV